MKWSRVMLLSLQEDIQHPVQGNYVLLLSFPAEAVLDHVTAPGLGLTGLQAILANSWASDIAFGDPDPLWIGAELDSLRKAPRAHHVNPFVTEKSGTLGRWIQFTAAVATV